ncbi:exopolygalacturonase-like [Ricinus communis]|uniref:exopolygalacturonase-like n=1 Tax=Ricinus communis TaxID=3988 RepID=UPI00201AE15C|nr:exopolygalacturonase-like [Ricinus communis]
MKALRKEPDEEGYTYLKGLDYTETFSPVAKLTTVHTLLAVTAIKNWIPSTQVHNIFLHSDLNEEVYMKPPLGYLSPGDDRVLLSAWKNACATMGSNKIVIPKRVYFLSEADIKDPCKGAIRFQVRGTIKAPIDPSAHSKTDSWITFSYIDQFILNGEGTFDGQGEIAWKNNNCGQNLKCNSLPISLRFNFITNSIVHDIASIQSKNFHVNILGCKNLTFQNFTITAPATSANTDGIHIGRSNGINITDSNISTGDDCISLGDGSQQIRVTNVRCRPGHGISVGSLGKFKNEELVSGFFVKNCTISNTTNGVRIKTWPVSYGGTVSDMHFKDIKMENVTSPIIWTFTSRPSHKEAYWHW